MSEWKCGKCGIEYPFEEFIKLPKVQLVETDDNPKEQHGFTSVCKKCGYIFGKDRLMLRETITIKFKEKEYKVDVSTVFLELNHFGFYYETMIFSDGLNCDFQERYKTKEEVIKRREEVIEKLKKGSFKINVERDRLDVLDIRGEKK